MARRRVKVEFQDGDGARYTVSLDGHLSRDKVLRIMDLVELLSPTDEGTTPAGPPETAFARVSQLIENAFALGSFTSADLLEAFEDRYQQPIPLTTLATYLARLAARGFLQRQRTPHGWSYRRVRLLDPTSAAPAHMGVPSRPIR